MVKKNRKPPPPTKPGIAYQHLIDFYQLPAADNKLKNGHVLFVHIQNGKSIAKTQLAVCQILPHGFTTSANHVKTLVKKYEQFKKLSVETEWKKFVNFCCEEFKVIHVTVASCPFEGVEQPVSTLSQLIACMTPSSSAPLQSATNPSPDLLQSISSVSFTSASPEPSQPRSSVCLFPSPGLSDSSSIVSTPTFSLRNRDLTPRKRLLKDKCHYLSKKRWAEKKKYKQQIKSIKAKLDLSKVKQIKYLNQDIARKKLSMKVKDAKIKLLKKQLAESNNGTLLSNLKQIQRKHKRLKSARKSKRKVKKTVPLENYVKLQKELKEKDKVIVSLQSDKLELEEKLDEQNQREVDTLKDKKTYGLSMRMLVYDLIVNNVPTENIPHVVKSNAKRNGQILTSIPCRTTVEQMARELDSIADLKSAELVTNSSNVTLAFDATTQEGCHVNSIHITTDTACDIIAVDELAGGNAEDYHDQITASIDNISEAYADFHKEEFQDSRSRVIGNIANTMTDRAAVNGATVKLLNESWNKNLNQFNCHLHPLDSIASNCRSTLKSLETAKGDLFGNDCLIGNIVLAVNKLRYKDGKGDPRGFKTFLLDNKLPTGLIPRYRGNRLHILFNICGKFVHYYDIFLDFFSTGSVSCGGLLSCIKKDFSKTTARVEMHVLGLLGKTLTGPWMSKFYTGIESDVSHVEGISIVKCVVQRLKEASANPTSILHRKKDFFDNDLQNDDIYKSLTKQPHDMALFCQMMSSCLSSIVSVLERQFKRYFELSDEELTEIESESSSTRLHNIDAESVMGMYSAGKERSKNANLDYLVARMRAKKNAVVPWLDEMCESKHEKILTWAMGRARNKRRAYMNRQTELRSEISRRVANKRQQKTQKERNDVDKKLKKITNTNEIQDIFPDLPSDILSGLMAIWTGTVVGRRICHTWYDEKTGATSVWSGKIEKWKKRKASNIYKIAYWDDDGSYQDSVDYDIKQHSLAADLIFEDLTFCK